MSQTYLNRTTHTLPEARCHHPQNARVPTMAALIYVTDDGRTLADPQRAFQCAICNASVVPDGPLVEARPVIYPRGNQ